ncbi:MAG: hypothetical protein B6I36_10215 [Desulfobacteraceae bacterium 4572_35.1]|nr:MAG: hypothetical protein B6I36_10215 [Desulfobacteraceae bacterium 4572_35.1]
MSEEKVTIDGKEYAVEDFSETAKQNLISLQLVNQKIAQNQQELAILQTARNAYASVLKEQLPEGKKAKKSKKVN